MAGMAATPAASDRCGSVPRRCACMSLESAIGDDKIKVGENEDI
jgi:hypothetical protein